MRRIARFVVVVQVVLFLAHLVLWETWKFFSGGEGSVAAGVVLGILSVSFVAASLLAFRYHNMVVRVFYRIAAAWLGAVNYLFWAACGCWLVWGIARVAGHGSHGREYGEVFLFLGVAVSIFGLVNAGLTRVKRIRVELENLPAAWRGRTAVLVSDVHLGNVRSFGFIRKIVRMINAEKPNIVFIDGDLYDGTKADVEELAQPLSGIIAPLGSFFVEGNHEEFSDHSKYLEAVAKAGVRVLNNELVEVEGLQIVGVAYRDATHGEHFRKTLRRTGFDRNRASVLLTHAPDRPQIAAEEGISLQVSGHTHYGQFFPYNMIARRVYGKFVYGLQTLGKMLVYTSTGAGTWGPPLRVGTNPEIVVIEFA